MPKLTLKQRKAGFTNAYEVCIKLVVMHETEANAKSYVDTMLRDWSGNGKIIPCYELVACEETSAQYLGGGISQASERMEG
jgi:hypothetical protein